MWSNSGSNRRHAFSMRRRPSWTSLTSPRREHSTIYSISLKLGTPRLRCWRRPCTTPLCWRNCAMRLTNGAVMCSLYPSHLRPRMLVMLHWLLDGTDWPSVNCKPLAGRTCHHSKPDGRMGSVSGWRAPVLPMQMWLKWGVFWANGKMCWAVLMKFGAAKRAVDGGDRGWSKRWPNSM